MTLGKWDTDVVRDPKPFFSQDEVWVRTFCVTSTVQQGGKVVSELRRKDYWPLREVLGVPISELFIVSWLSDPPAGQ